MITFKTTRKEAKQILTLGQRANALANHHGIVYDVKDADMDLTACHLNGCPLDLAKLATCDDAEFAHDVFGIRRHLNRKTGKLTGHFHPRCALPVEAAKQS